MGLRSLRRFDVQATYSGVLATLSAGPSLIAGALLVQRYNSELAQVIYGSKGMFVPVFLICILVSGLMAGVACVLGWSSADQRRNDKSRRSWMGFFLGGAVMTLDVIFLLAFWMLRLEKPM